MSNEIRDAMDADNLNEILLRRDNPDAFPPASDRPRCLVIGPLFCMKNSFGKGSVK